MPYSIDIRIYAKQDCELPHPCSHMLHAALLSAVREKQPETAEMLHGSAQVKPFTVSTIWNRKKPFNNRLAISKYTECSFRVAALEQTTFDVLSSPLLIRLATGKPIILDGKEFHFLEANLEENRGIAVPYSELYQSSGIMIGLNFMSPTTFKRKGVSYPLPDPALIYGSLWQKWQAYSDIKADEADFEAMISALAIAKANVHTKIWNFPKAKQIGFVGDVVFELINDPSEPVIKLFSALSHLSYFAGVGYKTTMGMGQCRSFLFDNNNREDE